MWSPDLVWLLINDGHVDFSLQSDDGRTALSLACEQGDMLLIKKILELAPATVNLALSNGITPLHIATARGHREMALFLLDHGADINCTLPATKETLLHLVLGPSQSEISGKKWIRRPDWAMYFLHKQHGPAVNVNAKRGDGSTALLLACLYLDMPVAKRLLELRADPSAMRDSDGATPLLVAFDKNHQILARLLLGAGASLAAASRKRGGQTSLMTAVQRLDLEWARLLLQYAKPADIAAQADDGSCVLHYAAEAGSCDELSASLLLLSPTVDVRRADMCTPLHLASANGNTNAVRALLKRGADPRAKAHHNLTPLHLACRAGHAGVSKLLLCVGADADALCDALEEDDAVATPVTLAREAGNFKLVRFLMDPLRSSLAVMLHRVNLDAPHAATTAAAITSPMPTVVDPLSCLDVFEPAPTPAARGSCSICLEDNLDFVLTLSRCLHKFCVECLCAWFTQQYNGFTHPRCPDKDCGIIVSYYDLKACLGADMMAKYEDQMLKRSLMDIKDFRWCPSCHIAGGIAPCSDAVCASCGFYFCAQCMMARHEGSCATNFTRELERGRDERRQARQVREVQQSEQWIAENTKQCPGCKCNVKRSGGCSHITCKSCHYEWCWFCGGKYTGNYTFGDECPCR
eukprot:TRINITY_DN2414_c0_g1_i3.p1 TRINITY_DN2414_c0_g1~~TRINITY_DN2414_c0_g1_i3.p1  ORF type:complete len:636 (-),score=156.19 TRINITY_DN2414_c0_g1_i3:79-1986(-)